jgi:catechol 2,3-dioxygenase-like lactoylglutathione lyase family enzyme
LTVDDLDTVLNAMAASGWKTAGQPQTLQTGPNAGKRVVYVRDPDGTTIEFMQPPSPNR